MRFALILVCAAVSAASVTAPAFASEDLGFSAKARESKSAAAKAARAEAKSPDRVCYAQAGGCTGLPSNTGSRLVRKPRSQRLD